MKNRLLDSREFFRLLQSRSARNAERIDRTLRERAERDVTIFMSDSSGFTRKTHEYGIEHFLAVMTQHYRRLLPVFRKHGGVVLSTAADNLLAVFDEPADALKTSIEIQQRLRRSNAGKKDEDQFHLCIGIERGRALVLKDNAYGACVNVASKLGEDLAGKGEILVTGGVAQLVKRRFRCAYHRSAEIGGRPFELFRVRY
ncbi:MAG TPA: adenylate/guanylate cyclase domain-containing protein [Planctomycetota bacterium]|jgi:class 3 adenylate cyclase|nr:adenylate/guanylate cyclase domain-containing protein [Planctomycetota bacterium]